MRVLTSRTVQLHGPKNGPPQTYNTNTIQTSPSYIRHIILSFGGKMTAPYHTYKKKTQHTQTNTLSIAKQANKQNS